MPEIPPFDAAARAAAWRELTTLASAPHASAIRPLFEAEPGRAARLTARLDDLTLDVSKSSVSEPVMTALLALLDASGFTGFRDRLFAGEVVNPTEGRAAMHMALRAPRAEGMKAALPAGVDDAARIVADELAHMRDFVERVHSGALKGFSGESFDTVLNIGIGGSDLGPRMACEALTLVHGGRMRARFLSNVDGHAFEILKRELDPARTLVLVASKTFTTLETLTNAHAARDWLAGALGEQAVGAHFAALSTNRAQVEKFGISAERMFGFRDWVGGTVFALVAGGAGRSRSPSVGTRFQQHARRRPGPWTRHFRDRAVARKTCRCFWRSTGIWNVNALGLRDPVRAGLRRPPAPPARATCNRWRWRANGKTTSLLDGTRHAAGAPAPILFGEPGTNAQHSFIQLVHQGTRVVPVDFILAAESRTTVAPTPIASLAANAFAQAEALLMREVASEDTVRGGDARPHGASAAGDRRSWRRTACSAKASVPPT